MNEWTLWLIITLLTGIQGFFLSLAILTKSKGRNKANRLLSLFILLISLTMVGRLSFYYAETEEAFLPGGLVDIIIFCYGPLAYFYLNFLLNDKKDWHQKDGLHVLPLLIYLVYFFYRLLFPTHFEDSWVYTRLGWVYFFLELLALLQNGAYAYWGYKTVKDYELQIAQAYSVVPQLKYIRIFLGLVSIIVMLWGYGFLSKYVESLHYTTVFSYNFVWILLSCLTFLFAYFSYFEAGILLLPEKPAKYEQGYFADDYYLTLKGELQKLMENDKPYLQPQLTLQELSALLQKNPRDVSRVINEHFQQNFYEFVNTYRIREFQKLADTDKSSEYTILALAYESGFNSKATFNAAFKKITQLTPREYLSRKATV